MRSAQESWEWQERHSKPLNNEEKYAWWQLQLISVEHQDYEWYKMH